jgi:hypothetical protein
MVVTPNGIVEIVDDEPIGEIGQFVVPAAPLLELDEHA